MLMSLRSQLNEVVNGNSSAPSKVFHSLVLIMVLVALASFSLDTVGSMTPEQERTLEIVELFCVGFFTLEYLLRIWVAPSRFKYLFSFHGIIDFITIAPFYIALGFDHRPLRALRLLRVFAVLKLLRYSVSLDRMVRAFHIGKGELGLFLGLSVFVIYLAAVGIYYFESTAQPDSFSSIPASLWWAVVTLTTVGYGDMYPVTAGGRAFTFIILFVGLGLVAVPAGIISSALSEARRQEEGEGDRQ